MAVANQRDQRIARVIDREVAPLWHDRFASLIFRNLPPVSNGVVLDVHCATGRTTSKLLGRLDPSTRVIALDPSEPNLTLARARVKPEWKKRVYFKPGDVTDVTGMGDDSYDLTVANLVLAEAHDWASVVAELIRVTKPGGEVLATLPMRGTWAEVEDLFYEVLLHEGLDDAMRRLSRLAQMRPTGAALATGLEKLGVDADNFVVEQDRLQLLFPSGREFLFAPNVEHGPLRLWKAIIGEGAKPQELFWRLKEAIDVYFAGHVFATSIVAGLLRIQVPAPGSTPLARTYWSRYPELDAIFEGRAVNDSSEADEADEEFDLDIDLDDEVQEEAAETRPPPGPSADAATDEEIFAAMEGASEEDADIESMLDEVFLLDEEPEAETSRQPPPAPVGGGARETTASRLGLKIGSTSPRVPPPPTTGPNAAVPSRQDRRRGKK